ncbi:hypothetical protein PVAND_000169 [Polypedilum vanderplanki]|uniref:Kazal-like domain-containing protein n=1 Tax=Polypedilum vanderplanki TaxID=319348 RepID=A0A9J6BKH4_POLVA|nr:hypothetical protein PVAND_000169 [Polypedilum vanderplanki]
MKFLIFIILFVAIFSLSNAQQQQLPCYKCRTDYKPVCAQSIHGGPPKTYTNKCIMDSENCGKYEPQNTLLYEGECN